MENITNKNTFFFTISCTKRTILIENRIFPQTLTVLEVNGQRHKKDNSKVGMQANEAMSLFKPLLTETHEYSKRLNTFFFLKICTCIREVTKLFNLKKKENINFLKN